MCSYVQASNNTTKKKTVEGTDFAPSPRHQIVRVCSNYKLKLLLRELCRSSVFFSSSSSFSSLSCLWWLSVLWALYSIVDYSIYNFRKTDARLRALYNAQTNDTENYPRTCLIRRSCDTKPAAREREIVREREVGESTVSWGVGDWAILNLCCYNRPKRPRCVAHAFFCLATRWSKSCYLM